MLSSLWLGDTLFRSVDDLKSISWKINLLKSSYSVVALIVSAYASAYVYYLILNKNDSKLPTFPDIVNVYFTSRLVRYLPGRIWLYIYQINKMSVWISAKNILIANFEEFLLIQTNTLSIFVASILLSKQLQLPAIFCYLTGTFICFFLQRKSIFLPVISFFYKIFKQQPLVYEISRVTKNINQYQIVLCIQLEWFCYLISWYFISPNVFTFTDLLCLSSAYAVAWMIGFLAVIMPGGLVVREASFIWLCANLWSYEQSQLIFFSLLMRLLFIIGDILSFLLSILIKFINRSTARSVI